MTANKIQRYSISVSSRTYDRLRAAVDGSVAAFVEDIVTGALDDPTILARVMGKCPPRKEAGA